MNSTDLDPDARAELGIQIDPGVSEIGARLGDFLLEARGTVGAVITDHLGDTVDFSFVHHRVSLLDVELAGAQVAHAIDRIRGIAVIFGLGDPAILLEGASAGLIVHALEARCNLAVLLDTRVHLAGIWRQLPFLVDDLNALLR